MGSFASCIADEEGASRIEREAAGAQCRSDSTIMRCDALIRYPESRRQLAPLPEHIDRHAAARIPVAADAQPLRLDRRDELLGDRDRAVLVEGAVVAEAREI